MVSCGRHRLITKRLVSRLAAHVLNIVPCQRVMLRGPPCGLGHTGNKYAAVLNTSSYHLTTSPSPSLDSVSAGPFGRASSRADLVSNSHCDSGGVCGWGHQGTPRPTSSPINDPESIASTRVGGSGREVRQNPISRFTSKIVECTPCESILQIVLWRAPDGWVRQWNWHWHKKCY